MKLKPLTLVLISAVIIAGCVFVAGCVSQNNVQDNKGIIGTWVSEGTYEAGNITFNQVYTFKTDTSGTLSAVSVSDGKIIKTVQVMWAYDADQKAYMAFTPNTGNYDYLLLSDDGQTIVSEYGEIYTKV